MGRLTLRRVKRTSSGGLPADVAKSILKMDRRCFPDDTPVSLNKAWWWLVTDGGTPVGYAGMVDLGSGVFDMVRVGVLNAYRGRGLGKRLLKARLAFAQSQPKAQAAVTMVHAGNYQSLNNLVSAGFRGYKHPGRMRDFVYLRKPL